MSASLAASTAHQTSNACTAITLGGARPRTVQRSLAQVTADFTSVGWTVVMINGTTNVLRNDAFDKLVLDVEDAPHEHCPVHGCVEYVCCEPKAVPAAPVMYGVRVRLANRRTDDVKIVEKSFKSAEARARWLDAQDDLGLLIEVLGFQQG